MEISQVCKVFSFTCWSFSRFQSASSKVSSLFSSSKFKHIGVGRGRGDTSLNRQKLFAALPLLRNALPKLLSKLILSVWMLIRSDPVVEMHFLSSSNWFSPPRLNESEPVFKVQEGKGREGGAACPRPSNSPVVAGRPPARAELRPTWKLMLGIIKLAPEVSNCQFIANGLIV